MKVQGRVRDGRLLVDEEVSLPEGTVVTLTLAEPAPEVLYESHDQAWADLQLLELTHPLPRSTRGG